MQDSKERFSSRVENYIKYRPHYPGSIIEICQQRMGLEPHHVIADIGAGTGISSELFVNNGNTVYGVEPNDAMLQAANTIFKENDKFHAIKGTAEATTLAENSVDYVIAGQAYHWFDHQAFQTEARRILKDHGWLIIMWNSRESDSAFNSAYEGLCQQFGNQYSTINQMTARAESLLEKMNKVSLENQQFLDLEGLTGRFLSSSYAPQPEHESFKACLLEIDRIFKKHQIDGKIILRYETEVFYQQL